MSRVYLDWNATAPLRPEARAAMLAAMDAVGNPSSVHAEGRAARAIVERARGQVARLVGCEPSEVVFTSGATEAVGIVAAQDWDDAVCSPVEHDAVAARFRVAVAPFGLLSLVDGSGQFLADRLDHGFGLRVRPSRRGDPGFPRKARGLFAICAANSETGVVQPVEAACREFAWEMQVSHRLCDATQAMGKLAFAFSGLPLEYAACSGHKIGGPKGTGALVVRSGIDISAQSVGGGQELGRRAGTENVIGIAGFGAAAEAAVRDLEDGVWERVERLRDDLEARLVEVAPEIIIFGKDVPRLPNTSCFAVPGWKGETQVMQMDLAGFAVSAGSACSSGKVGPSRVLRAMGYDEVTASSAIRVSLGPVTTEAEVTAFATAWTDFYRRRKAAA